MGLQSGLARLKRLILAGGCRHRLCLVLSGSRLGSRNVSLELLLDFFALHAKDLGEGLASVGVLSLTELGSRVDIIEGRHFLDVRLANLADHLFLLFSELPWVNDWLLWSRLGGLSCLSLPGSRWFRRVLFLFLSFLL